MSEEPRRDGMERTFLGDPMDEVSEALRMSRRRYGFSQRELAAVLGVDRALVGRWESGRGPQGLAQVAAVLGVLGFVLSVRPLRPDEWKDLDDPIPHLADRGLRRFPAHLEATTGRDATADWVRYRWSENPYAPGWTYRMDPARRAELEHLRHEPVRIRSRAAVDPRDGWD